ncbi:MAG TPA: dinitrogenase iron-molybdenum cofactor N-terminal domain-containing protein [Pseudomonas sp.]|jgi:nitrogen fixation protein NifX|uniref:dinitrogenase iron-molybdenum cofactor N-terminal domain-containing protein n=1 Tax=Pseudomonas sp. TaxID=306 RepID=UPI002ED81BCC
MSSAKPWPRLADHLALRIALAARELTGIDTAHLIAALLAITGEPLTESRLCRVRASRLRASLGDGGSLLFSDRQLQCVIELLRGRGVQMPEPVLPAVAPYCEGDLPDSIRIACASDHAEYLDAGFAGCARFLIYQVSPLASRLIQLRTPEFSDEQSPQHASRAELLKDCELLYTLSIGGPACARLIRAGVHPIRIADPVPTCEVIDKLQRVLARGAPPWLAKIMGDGPDQRVRFNGVY